jgi:hypothetical protein
MPFERVIHVENGRAIVSRYHLLYAVAKADGSVHREMYLEPADNWESLEPAALAAVQSQGGAANLPGVYGCPHKLAVQARFYTLVSERQQKG